MGQPVQRRHALKSIVAAAFAFGLAGCGGGGGGEAPPIDSGGGSTGTPGTIDSPGTTEPTGPTGGTGNPPVAQSSFFASWTGALLDAAATLPGAAPATPQSVSNQSVRQIVRLSLGGDTVRIKLSNRFGASPLAFSGVHLALSTGAGNIDPGTDRPVTFGGQTAVTLAPGAELLSDAVALPVAALAMLAVTMHFAGAAVLRTVHSTGLQTTYIAPGNQLSAANIVPNLAILRESYYALAAVETSSTEATKVVVAFGDSLTDGVGSGVNASKRYPDQLDDRLKAGGFARVGVVNAGIGGNRWLNDFAGPSGNSRFQRDVLEVSGVTHTIIQMGINDIGFSVDAAPTQEVSAQQIIDSIGAAVAKAKARGIKVLLGTLAPYKGSASFDASGEAKRQAVNAAIRGAAGIDGVVDFDLVLQNPADPASMNPAFDSGDHLHPNSAGYAAIAAAIDLSKLTA
jgi:lysophospholipase L1-like esterase